MKFATSAILPAILLLPSLILHFSTIEPFHRGYFCQDTSIKYPYVEQQTVPTYLCFVIWSLLSVMVFGITFITQKSWKMLLDVMFKLVLGFSICMLLTDVSKFSLGRLRPHFLTICNPDLEDVCYQLEEYNEDNGTDYYYYSEVIHLKYVENETCTGNKNALKEARLSFVSGHSSISFYMAVFLILFMKKHTSPWILRTLLQVTYLILALWISITRINDHMHHPEDVIMGSCIGIICGFIVHRVDVSKNLIVVHTPDV